MRDAPFSIDLTSGELEILRRFAVADFDPLSGLALVGGAMSAMGTLAAGSNAAAMGRAQQQAEQFQATQDRMNAAADIAAAQRKSLDTMFKANLVRSTAVASAAAGGVTTTSGSPLTNEAQIASRGHYASALDLWNGQDAATGDLNKALAADYTGEVDAMGGEMARDASYFSAFGTLASSGASAFKMYGLGSGSSGTSFFPSASFLTNGLSFG